MRYLVPFFLLLVFASSVTLASRSLFYAFMALAQACFYGAAALSWLIERAGGRSRILALPQYFVIANLASVLALYQFLRGERYSRWEPIREHAGGIAQVTNSEATVGVKE
jgi:hypothetical protein